MNVQPVTIQTVESYTRVPERWLGLARGCWVALVVLTLAIFCAGLPGYLTQLQTPCDPSACEYQQLTSVQGETLQGSGLSTGYYAAFTAVLLLVSVAVSLVVSALIIWRRPDDWMAFIIALLLVTAGPTLVTATAPVTSPWLMADECATFLTIAFFLLAFSLFPNGRFVPDWMSWILAVFLVVQILFTFFPSAPFALTTSFFQLSWLVFLGGLAVVALLQLYRYRWISSPLQRQQTKWVVFGLAMPTTVNVFVSALVFFFPGTVEQNVLVLFAYNEVGFLLTLCLPLSLGFAILRSRLWDIDTLINRTLVYTTLTVLLTALYAGMIIGLQTLLSGFISKDNNVAIVLSTLTIAALFQPLRSRIQVLIDRRFYRRTYDAARTLAAFSATLRHEVDVSRLSEQLVAVVEETMQPAHISLWLFQSYPTTARGETANNDLDSYK